MEKKTKQVQVEKTIYVTKDGKEFDSQSAASEHEDFLNGKKKKCSQCNGKGYINERSEREWVNTSWIPTEGEYQNVTKRDTCPTCKGKGYLELTWQ